LASREELEEELLISVELLVDEEFSEEGMNEELL